MCSRLTKWLLLIPKILDLKAIHNYPIGCPGLQPVVTDPKDIGFESNSQLDGKNGEPEAELLLIPKILDLKAIHN